MLMMKSREHFHHDEKENTGASRRTSLRTPRPARRAKTSGKGEAGLSFLGDTSVEKPQKNMHTHTYVN